MTTRTLRVGMVALMAAPGALQAQQSRTRAPLVRTTSSRCAELTSSPTMLSQAPEGRALLRYKRELENVAEVVGQRADSSRSIEIQRISQAQRGVDSLLQVIVRIARDDVGDRRTMTVRRGDSLRVMVGDRPIDARALFESVDGTIRMIAPNIEATIRSWQPQAQAFSEAARMHLPMKVSAPSGWLGLHLSESKLTMLTPEGAVTNYCDYPVIETVDPGSPAEKGGLNAGDTVLAYNGRDVLAQAVNYGDLLVPGQPLRLRVKRGTRARELTVTVGVRSPAERTMVERAMAERANVLRAQCAPGATCERTSQFTFSSSPAVIAAPPPAAPLVEAVLAGTGMAVLAGAQLSVIDEEFAQSMGVEPGVLVMRVPLGTPAAEAGLRAGDVIRAVNGTPLRDLAPLRRAFGAGSSREVKLTVSARGASPRIVTVKW